MIKSKLERKLRLSLDVKPSHFMKDLEIKYEKQDKKFNFKVLSPIVAFACLLLVVVSTLFNSSLDIYVNEVNENRATILTLSNTSQVKDEEFVNDIFDKDIFPLDLKNSYEVREILYFTDQTEVVNIYIESTKNENKVIDVKVSQKMNEYYIKINNSRSSYIDGNKVTFYRISDTNSLACVLVNDGLIYEIRTESIKIKEFRDFISLLLENLND